ncbi:helix-turn-helix domain-containing protein [Streptomyces sp. NBC_00648]|uniref:helix-turn-helix domain-containing protein n=1 Tax=Streptomyces sp. NBC_00648 TaxID=2975797 RepID=UPI00324D1FA9
MPTLGSLSTNHPEARLAFLIPGGSKPYHDVPVTGLVVLPLARLLEGRPLQPVPAGSIVVLTGAPGRFYSRDLAAVDRLLRHMSAHDAVALVFTISRDSRLVLPRAVRDLADELAIVLMVSTAPAYPWRRVHETIQQGRVAAAERTASQMTALVRQLPAQLADRQAMQRIVDWLATSLRAQVMVSDPERVHAASPASAAEYLAPLVIRQTFTGTAPTSPARHSQLVPLGVVRGREPVLAVARDTPFASHEMQMLRHAAKLLGLVDQAQREYGRVADATRAARAAVAELLFQSEVATARRIIDGLTPGLLDPETARVFVLESDPAGNDRVRRRCEGLTASKALVVPDPRMAYRTLIVHPVQPDTDVGDALPEQLIDLVREVGPSVCLGGSGVYSMGLLADALQEAIGALAMARHLPGSVVLSAQETKLIDLLPQPEAYAWACCLLRPLMRAEADWEQLRVTLPRALAYSHSEAARRLGLHRNTVTRHLGKASELLHMDLAALTTRTALALALEVVTRRQQPVPDHVCATPPSLLSLLAAPEFAAWAASLLRPAQQDRRPLVLTAEAWLTHDARTELTARTLGISQATVRSRLRALEQLTGRDLTSPSGMRDLLYALHLVNGTPVVAPGTRVSCAA